MSADESGIERFVGAHEYGNRLDSDPEQTQLSFPFDAAVFSDGRALIVDTYNRRVLVVSADGSGIELFAGSGEQGKGLAPDPKLVQFHSPRGIAVLPDGRVLIADTYNHRVLLIPTGSI